MLKELAIFCVFGTALVLAGDGPPPEISIKPMPVPKMPVNSFFPTSCNICNGLCGFINLICIEIPDVIDCSEAVNSCKSVCEKDCDCEHKCPKRCQVVTKECSGSQEVCGAKYQICDFLCRVSCPLKTYEGIVGDISKKVAIEIEALFPTDLFSQNLSVEK